MQRDSNLHSPRVDDAMAKEASSVTHGAPVEPRTDEERLVEGSADGEPVPQSLAASGATLGGATESATAGHVHPATTPSEKPLGAQRFEFRFDRLYEIAALPFGVTRGRAFVDLGRETLVASFGFWRVETPIDNVARVEQTGPHAVPKTIGPPHVSLADGGLTFATTNAAGVRIRFYEAVRGIEPIGVVRHPSLTVTVADPEALIHALSE
jgi:hypothetical protein